MANEQHLEILKKGVEAWNQWRKQNPEIQPDLSEGSFFAESLKGANLSRTSLAAADLNGADLRGADLNGAKLDGAALTTANLYSASLQGASLSQARLNDTDLSWADFTQAELWEADLRRADLYKTNFSRAFLKGADFSDSVMLATSLGYVDLSAVKGLETVRHIGPSTIGIDTIYMSEGNIPEAFLRGAGVPLKFIESITTLVREGTEFYSCFIGYANKDEEFAAKLHRDLRARGVRCWRFSEDARWGEAVWGEIDRSIKKYDKLVVICSKDSLHSGPVLREIERALQREDREKKNVLFPIRIDDYLFQEWEHLRKTDVVSKIVGDFREWRVADAYSKAMDRLVDALNKPQEAARSAS